MKAFDAIVTANEAIFSLIGMGLDKLGRSLSKEVSPPIINETNEFVVCKNEKTEVNVNISSTSSPDRINISNEKIEIDPSESNLTIEQSIPETNEHDNDKSSLYSSSNNLKGHFESEVSIIYNNLT